MRLLAEKEEIKKAKRFFTDDMFENLYPNKYNRYGISRWKEKLKRNVRVVFCRTSNAF